MLNKFIDIVIRFHTKHHFVMFFFSNLESKSDDTEKNMPYITVASIYLSLRKANIVL